MSILANADVNLSSAMSTAFNNISTDINGYIGSALPVALGIVGTVLAITVGIKVFKKITGKA